MIISTDISDARADQIESLSPSLRRQNPALVLGLYHLAERADHYDQLWAPEIELDAKFRADWKRHYAECAGELFDDLIFAAAKGELR